MAFNVKQTSIVRETCLQPTLSDVRRTHAIRDIHDSAAYADTMRISTSHIHAEKALHQGMESNGKQGNYDDANPVPLLFEPGLQHRFPYEQHMNNISEQYFYGAQEAPSILPVANHQRGSYSLLQAQNSFIMKGHEIPTELLSSSQAGCDLVHESGYAIGHTNPNHLSHRFSSNSVCEKHRIKPYSPCDLEDISDDERERVRVKREKNRVAAAKCRNRRRELLERLEKETEQLEREQELLKENVRRLQQQKVKLGSLLDEHESKCANKLDIKCQTDDSRTESMSNHT